ncbi:MAG TPA: patatin-like phospholipase family protein [Aldersonia sp.]
MTTAFVLSGGGSLGSIQVGMLQALIARGITPDVICGTSVGALNGAWLASGATVENMHALADLWRGLHRRDIFPFSPLTGMQAIIGRSDHLVSNRSLRRLVEDNITFDRLEDAPIPLHVVATDVLSGRDVPMAHGPAVDAVLASAAIPGLLPTVIIDERPLMDGGVVNNTPIAAAVDLGADTIWVLTTGAACELREPPRTVLGMALQGITLAINDRLAVDVRQYENKVDLRVAPPLCPMRVNPADFGHGAELIERAEESTSEWLDAGVPGRGQAALLEPHHH